MATLYLWNDVTTAKTIKTLLICVAEVNQGL